MMPDEKQLVLRKILTRKVWRLVETDREPTDAAPVPNRWEGTLDDLVDDPDFKEVYRYNSLEFPRANDPSLVGAAA
jgi:hypothetical protein